MAKLAPKIIEVVQSRGLLTQTLSNYSEIIDIYPEIKNLKRCKKILYGKQSKNVLYCYQKREKQVRNRVILILVLWYNNGEAKLLTRELHHQLSIHVSLLLHLLFAAPHRLSPDRLGGADGPRPPSCRVLANVVDCHHARRHHLPDGWRIGATTPMIVAHPERSAPPSSHAAVP